MNRITRTLTAIAFALSSGAALADHTVKSKDGTFSYKAHSEMMSKGLNANGDLQVEAYVTKFNGNETSRERVAVVGCDKSGGLVGVVDTTTNTVRGPQKPWFYQGGSMLDGMATAVCAVSAQDAEKRHGAKKSR